MPKVAFSSPPSVEFVYSAICSVRYPSLSASGHKAMSEKMKRVASPPSPLILHRIASGTEARRRLSLVP